MRLNKETGHQDLSPSDRAAINQNFSKLRTTRGVIKEGTCMKPLVLTDVERIISSISLADENLSLDVSLFLFAFATGARV